MRPSRPPLFSISMISAAILAYEILLVHLFAIIQPHHFSSLVISLAMLGFGLSGTLTTLFSDRLLQNYTVIYPLCLGLCGLTMVYNFFLTQALPLNGEQLFWDVNQIFVLTEALILLLIPFFAGGMAISLTFCRHSKISGIIYSWDLCGAGFGCLLILILLFLFFPAYVLVSVGTLCLLAAAVACVELQVRYKWITVAGLALITVPLAISGTTIKLAPSPYKTLQQYLQVKGARIVTERHSPLGLIQVVENNEIPIRHAPGLSLGATHGPPPQLGLFINGESLSAITKINKDPGELHYLDKMTTALPYHLKKPGNILLPGVGGGADILQARYHSGSDITCVELNPQLVDLLREKYNRYSGRLLDGVRITTGNIRFFLTEGKQHYDLIQLSLLTSFLPSVSGLGGVGENYYYTVEAIQQYIARLSPQGYLAITSWVKNPPRDTLKLLATVITTLRQENIENVERYFVLIRGWQTSTILVKKSMFTPKEIKKIETFCKKRSFDIAYTFQADPSQVNRHNILREPIFYQASLALLGDQYDHFIKNYKFDIKPATDNRPYFNVFFKWSALREIWQLKAKGGAALIESGYLVLATALSIAVVLSFVLICGPLILLRKTALKKHIRFSITRVLPYFFLTGIGFLLVEIAFIQQFILFLGHPLYAFSLCVATFLIFGGFGSRISHKLSVYHSKTTLIKMSILGIAVIIPFYQFQVDDLFRLTANLPFSGKLGLSIALICPLATFMGMPFPLGLSALSSHNRTLIPWGWGVNGCGSVISSLLASILAIHFGFKLVILTALAAYLILPFCFPAAERDR